MERTFVTTDGLRLAADCVQGARETPVLLLHGGGQTRHAWGATVRSLADRGWPVVAIDMRGHGDSDWAPDGDYSLDAFAADVAAVAGALDAPPVLVGASLGGLSSLLAVSAEPALDVSGLVLVDVAHRFDANGATRVVDFMRARPEGFEHPDEAVAAVAAYLPHREREREPGEQNGILKNLRDHEGRWRWHWDPAVLGGATRPLMDPDSVALQLARLRSAVERLTIPTLLVRGAMSDVVTPEIAAEFAALAPAAEVVDVSRAGHMVAGDSNDSFTSAIATFLERR